LCRLWERCWRGWGWRLGRRGRRIRRAIYAVCCDGNMDGDGRLGGARGFAS
jgi:hypothetical protein